MAKKNETPQITDSELRKTIDELASIESKIEDLKSKASVLEADLKEKGSSYIQSAFGSVNLLGSSIIAQIQRRRPSISIFNGNIQEAEDLLGDKFGLLFDIETDGKETLRESKISELKKLITEAKKDPADFFALNRTAKAKDTLLEEPVRNALLGKKAAQIFEKLSALWSCRGALAGVIALKWNAKKE
jgi:hypothetical protein